MPVCSPLDQSPEARAARAVPDHQQPVCGDFTVQPEPSAFWCGVCGWNRPLHDDAPFRAAVAAELQRIAALSEETV